MTDSVSDDGASAVEIAVASSTDGVHPFIAVIIGLWYSLIAAAGMSSGFRYLVDENVEPYWVLQSLMWIIGIGIGIGLGVSLSRTRQLFVGVACSILMSGLILSLLFFLHPDDYNPLYIFGQSLTVTQVIPGNACAVLLLGLIGTFVGRTVRADAVFSESLLGIRHGHWWWLWIAVFAWASILPTGLYYFWLEIVSTFYVLIHPSLWFNDAWTEGWTLTFGVFGTAAVLYGVGMSFENLSAKASSGKSTLKRVLLFWLGTFILAGGPVANVFYRLAIHTLKHLPDGITANPWWVLH